MWQKKMQNIKGYAGQEHEEDMWQQDMQRGAGLTKLKNKGKYGFILIILVARTKTDYLDDSSFSSW